MKKRDLIFILSVFAGIAILVSVNLLTAARGDTAEIYVNSKFAASLPLDENTVKEINGGTNRIRIENGYVYMEYADCPDKLCIKQGKISDSSRDIVCLPNRVTVKVTRKGSTDAVSR